MALGLLKEIKGCGYLAENKFGLRCGLFGGHCNGLTTHCLCGQHTADLLEQWVRHCHAGTCCRTD